MYLNLVLIIFNLINTGIGVEDDRPVLQELFYPKQLHEGQLVKLHCDLIKGKQPVSFKWKFNEKLIENNDDFQIINKDEETSLKIRNLSINHLGDFKCLAINSLGEDEKQAKLHFNGKDFGSIRQSNCNQNTLLRLIIYFTFS